MGADSHQGMIMPNRLKLPLALIVASLLLSACTPPPDGLPPHAGLWLASAAQLK